MRVFRYMLLGWLFGVCFTVMSVGYSETSAAVVHPLQSAASATAAAPQTIAEKIAAGRSKLDLNSATAEQLKVLPGIGDAYVKRIIDGRPYTAKNQLVTRGVLPKAAYDKISEQIIAHRPKSKPTTAKTTK